MYLTHEEYIQMGGQENELSFATLYAKAWMRIETLTHGRAKALSPVPDALKLATFEAVETLKRQRDAEGNVQAFQNDGMSVTYAQQTLQERESTVNAAIVHCLLGVMSADGKTPLVYAGVV